MKSVKNKKTPVKKKKDVSPLTPQKITGVIWWLNLIFLPVCLAALSHIAGFSQIGGFIAGLLLDGIIVLLHRSGRDILKKWAIRIARTANSIILLCAVLLSVYFLWGGLLGEAPPDLAEHTVLLFFLLGLGCIGILLRWLDADLMEVLPIEKKLDHLIGGPSLYISFCLAAILTSLTLILFSLVSGEGVFGFLTEKFLRRGIIPPLCLMLFYWELILLGGKYILSFRHVHRVVTGSVLLSLWKEYAGKKPSSKEKNSNSLDDFIDTVWRVNENFYFVPRYINWAIPIMGFIGTVLGISLAAGEIGNIVGSASVNVGESINAAKRPLSIAFDTTLIALSLSVVLVFLYTALQRWEEQRFLFLQEQLSQNS